jgi:integrase
LATVGFRIRTKNKSYVFIKIYLYAQKSVRLETSTGIKIYSKYWNKNLQQIDYEAPSYEKNNQKLIELKKYVLDKVKDGPKSNLDLPWLKLLVYEFNGGKKFTEENTVIFQSKLWIKNNSLRLKPNTIKFYYVFIKVIVEFEKDINQRLVFEELNLNLLEKFKNWLLNEKKYSINYSNGMIKGLKTISKEVLKREIKVNQQVFYLSCFKNDSSKKIINIISISEFEKIKNLKIQSNSLLNSKKWILIGYSIGQRVSDLLELSIDNVRQANNNGLYVDINQKKTGKFVTVGIVDKVVIDIILNSFPYKISNSKFNQDIKKIAELAEINQIVDGYKYDGSKKRSYLGQFTKYQLLSSHDLRRSFATNHYGKIPTPILMKLTGHSRESTLLEYVGKNANMDIYADILMDVLSKKQ